MELRLFNGVARYAGANGPRRRLSLPAGTAVGEPAARFGIPRRAVYPVLG